mgnify:CR=1 FL=1|jgi:hypothetical protein
MGRLIELKDPRQWGRGGRVRRAVESAERRFTETARRGVQELEATLENDARSVEGVLVRVIGAITAASVALSTAGAAIATNETNQPSRAKGNL